MVILLYSKVISIQKVHKKSGVFFFAKTVQGCEERNSETPGKRGGPNHLGQK